MTTTQAKKCTWAKGCRQPAVGELQAHTLDHAPWPLCAEHIKPRYHPADLQGKLVTWPEMKESRPE